MTMRLIALGVLAMLLAACAQAPRRDGPAPVTGPDAPRPGQPGGAEVRPYVPPGTQPAPHGRADVPRPVPNRAVQVLLRRSQDQIRDGELNAAAASLERAIRISPRDAELWYRLADLRERQGKFGQAADLAAKSNSLIGDSNPALSRDNWWLIARARRAVGDVAGARAAERKAVAYQSRLR